MDLYRSHWVTHINETGDVEWSHVYFPSNGGDCYALAELHDGTFCITGLSFSTLFIDEEGQLLHSMNLGSGYSDPKAGRGVISCNDGNIAIVGYRPDPALVAVWLFKLNYTLISTTTISSTTLQSQYTTTTSLSLTTETSSTISMSSTAPETSTLLSSSSELSSTVDTTSTSSTIATSTTSPSSSESSTEHQTQNMLMVIIGGSTILIVVIAVLILLKRR
jgi:hypothetical protein